MKRKEEQKNMVYLFILVSFIFGGGTKILKKNKQRSSPINWCFNHKPLGPGPGRLPQASHPNRRCALHSVPTGPAGAIEDVRYPKMDGENNGKPLLKMDDLGGYPGFFGNIHFICPKSKNPVAQICSLAKSSILRLLYRHYITLHLFVFWQKTPSVAG